MGKKKAKKGNYEDKGCIKIEIKPVFDYSAVVRKNNKAKVSRDFVRTTHKGTKNHTTTEYFTETEEIIDGSRDHEVKKQKKKRRCRISDNKFKQLCKEVEKECPRESVKGITFSKELSKMSKEIKYDESGCGYTPTTAYRKYYEAFPHKKANRV
ncbi:MAG: hypothetical protein GY775_19930 [Candidatus Scalindua sp.]|nr:hypothetical protein [Candidatus Scalindua sp.]